MKAEDQNGRQILYLRQQFPNKSDAKIKARVFTGPEMQNLICDQAFVQRLHTKEKAALYDYQKIFWVILNLQPTLKLLQNLGKHTKSLEP